MLKVTVITVGTVVIGGDDDEECWMLTSALISKLLWRLQTKAFSHAVLLLCQQNFIAALNTAVAAVMSSDTFKMPEVSKLLQ